MPSHPDTGPGCNAVVDDQSFVIAEVAVRRAVHAAVTERIQSLRGPTMSDTRAARIVARQSERGGGERGRTGQGRVRRGGPVDMELPDGELSVDRAERNRGVRRSGRRLSSAVEVGGQQTAEARAHIEALLRSRLPSQHARSVVSTDLAAGKIATRGGEEVERRVIGVRPHTYFGVIRKVCVAERVAIVGTGWIGRRRHSHALQIRGGREGRLRDPPRVGNGVVFHDGVTVVIRLASTAEAAPQRINGDGTKNGRATLVEHREVGVDDLDVVVRPDTAIGVGGRSCYREGTGRTRKTIADAIKIQCECGRQGLGYQRLQDWIGRCDASASMSRQRKHGVHSLPPSAGCRRHLPQWNRRIVPNLRFHSHAALNQGSVFCGLCGCAQDERARGHPSHVGAWSSHAVSPAEWCVGRGASDGRREKCDEKQRTCSETNEMAAHHTTPKSGVVLGYDREASDSHAAYLRGACYALEHGATRHQVATASCDRYRSRGPVAQWAALPGDRAGAKLPEPATVSRRPATGIAKRFSLRQSARVGYVETRPSLWQAA